jgi:hypothetical protein
MRLNNVETEADYERFLGNNPGFEIKDFGDGIGTYLGDEEGNVKFQGDEKIYNINTPEGQAALDRALTIAQARDPRSLKDAEAYLAAQSKSKGWSDLIGGDRTILAIMDALPPPDREAVMRQSLENVVSQLNAGDVSHVDTDTLASHISEYIRQHPEQEEEVRRWLREGAVPR